MTRRVVALVPVLLALGGCGTSDDRAEVRTVVEAFYDAVRQDRPDEACARLSESTLEQLESRSGRSCAAVITRLEYEGGAIVDVQVYATNAKVDLRNGESAFLSREADGWRLSAIACRPEEGLPRDRPYDCEAEA